MLLPASPPAPVPALPWGGVDFVQFYVAAELWRHGGNPYDYAAASARQRELGRALPQETYNPPWSFLPYLLPSALPFPNAVRVSLGLNLLLLASALVMYWRMTSPRDGGLLLLQAAATPLWLPVLALLGTGQTTAWVLFGYLAFHWAERRGKPALAGACLVLVAFKPHLGLPLLLAGAGVLLRRRSLGGLFTLLLAGGLLVLAPMCLRPSIWLDYWSYFQQVRPPSQYWSSTLDGLGRWSCGEWFGLVTKAGWLLGSLALGAWCWKAADAKGEALVALPPALALLLTPHAFSYDFILHLPAWWLAVRLVVLRPFPGWGWLPLGMALAAIALFSMKLQGWREFSLGWLPLFVSAWLVVCFQRSRLDRVDDAGWQA